MSPCTNTDNTFIDAQFKDCTPLGTVQNIKNILSAYGIEVEEKWSESSVPYCFSLRATVVGTTFGVNGKGLSKEFALASAYGELMERLQLGYLQPPSSQKDGSGSYCKTQDEYADYKQLLNDHPDWFLKLSECLKEYIGIDMTPDAILAQYATKNGKIHVNSFLSLNSLKQVYYPKVICNLIYTSNGCAAGNSPEEAIVQAISEVAERHHMLKTLFNGITPPDIPESVLCQYSTAYSIINYIREQDFKVTVKDCSLGKKFPVVCVCIVDNKTGNYHTHFGAYPVLEIALERALTESFQGRSLRNIAAFSNLLQLKPGQSDFNNIANELVYGGHEKSTYFFLGNNKYHYNEHMGFTGSNNKDLLRECVDYFKEQGYEILVRDCSCLGFCTYQVIIPGYSEAYIHRLRSEKNEHRYSSTAARFFRNPSAAPFPDVLCAMLHLGEMVRFSNIRNTHTFISNTKLSANLSPEKDLFLMHTTLAYAYYALGQYATCIENINRMIGTGLASDIGYWNCLKRNLELKAGGYTPEDIDQILSNFHSPDTIQRVNVATSSGRNPLEAYTLHCDLVHCDGCPIQNECCQNRMTELSAIISTKTLELDQDRLSQVMHELLL